MLLTVDVVEREETQHAVFVAIKLGESGLDDVQNRSDIFVRCLCIEMSANILEIE